MRSSKSVQKRVADWQPFELPYQSPGLEIHLWIQVTINKIEHVLSVCAEYTAGAGTIAVQTEGCNTRNNTAITQEIGTA